MSAYADIKDWDPKGSSSLSSIAAYGQIYNQIVQMDTQVVSKVVCDLCESWEVSNGGETVTFKLNQGIKWGDGEDLNTEDVLYSLRRYMDPETTTAKSGGFRNYTLGMDDGGITATDDHTFEMNLQFPSSAFLKFLAVDYVKILPEHLLSAGVDLNQAEHIINHGATSGPFVLDEYQRGNLYRVSKNENYFKGGRPYFDSINHFIITDTATLMAVFKTDQVHMSNSVVTNLAPAEAFELDEDTDGRFKPHSVSPSTDFGLMINVKKTPFNDARVREAIHLAIDYQQWNAIFDNTSGVGCPLMGMAHTFEECNTWPGLRPKNSPGGAEDIARAKALMAEAGYPDGFASKYDVREVGHYPDQCAVVKQSLKEHLNIEGEMSIYPSAAGYALFETSRPADQEGDWEMACEGEEMVVLDADSVFSGVYLRTGDRNYTEWENDHVNEMHDQQKVETDPARTESLKDIEAFLHSQGDNHWITLGWGVQQWIIGPNIRGFNAPQTGQTHFKHEDLWYER